MATYFSYSHYITLVVLLIKNGRLNGQP